MNTLVITNQTATRMVVIASRTNSELIAGAKAMMIQELKKQTPQRCCTLSLHQEERSD